jgi:peptide/nickel transport system permease protein
MGGIDVIETKPHVIWLKHFSRVFFGRSLIVFGIIVILGFILMAIFAPLIAPYDPNQIDPSISLVQPGAAHLLGTDVLGRDTLSRVIFGSRISLMAGVLAVLLAAFPGIAIGMIAGYYGRWVNMVIMRFVDALLSIPSILLAMLFAGLLGGGMTNVIVAIGVSMLPVYTRLMNGMVISTKGNDYILAVRSIGVKNRNIMFRHLLPNCFPPLIVLITMMIGLAIIIEASLSFLGVGIGPPTPSWGNLISDGYVYLRTNPMLSIAPGAAVVLIVLAFNIVGDGLRDALDPRLRGAS